MALARIEPARYGDLPALRLSYGGANAIVTPFGAQVLSWQAEDAVERLYLSPTSARDGSAPIRGGIPVIFPQWAERGPLTRHGFARRSHWQVSEERCGKDFALVTLRLTPAQLAAPFRQELPGQWWAEVTVLLSEQRLDIELAVGNEGTEPLVFTGGLHTYLAICPRLEAQLEGLYGVMFEEAGSGAAPAPDRSLSLAAQEPINRIYAAPPRPLLLRAGEWNTGIDQAEFADLVVWNPGTAHGLADLPDDASACFLCVEAAQLRTPVTLAVGEEWAGRQSLLALP